MSSLTMPIRILRRPASPPVEFDSERDVAPPAFGGDIGEEFGGELLILGREAMGFAGQRIPRQRLAKGLDQGLGQARMGRHGNRVLRGIRRCASL